MPSPYYERAGIRIYHGDCREVLPTLQADVLICDPPYGIAYESEFQRATAKVKRPDASPIANDADTRLRDWICQHWTGSAAIFGSPKASRPEATRYVVIWDKSPGIGCGMGDLNAAFGWSHEEICLLGDWPLQPGQSRRPSVISTSCAMGNPAGLVALTGHPTPKPLEVMIPLIQSAPAGMVLDPTCGSGSTLVACLRLERPAIGIELEEKYCEIAAKRLDRELAQGDLFVKRAVGGAA